MYKKSVPGCKGYKTVKWFYFRLPTSNFIILLLSFVFPNNYLSISFNQHSK